MTTYFLETSALVKRYVEEPGTPYVAELIRSGVEVFVSRLARVEAVSAMVRRLKDGDLSEDDFSRIEAEIAMDFQSLFGVVELGTVVITESVRQVKSHGLRTGDAVQLACAVVVGQSENTDVIFVSSDGALNAAAATEHFAVLDPAAQASE